MKLLNSHIFNFLLFCSIILPRGTFEDANSGITTYTIKEISKNDLSSVIKTDMRNSENEIKLLFNDTGIRPGKEYQVVVEAKACNESKVETDAVNIKTLSTIMPVIVLEKELFQNEVWMQNNT